MYVKQEPGGPTMTMKIKAKDWPWSGDRSNDKLNEIIIKAHGTWLSVQTPLHYSTWGDGGVRNVPKEAPSLLGWDFGVTCKKQIHFVPQNLISVCKIRFSNHNINYASNSFAKEKRTGDGILWIAGC